MPARKALQVAPLWELSLSYVSDNLDIWCNEALSVSDNPISRLPGIIKDEICKRSNTRKNLRPHHLNALIHPCTTNLNLDGIESRYVILRAVDLVRDVCQNITYLNLHKIVDHDLRILGENCSNLLELDIRPSYGVTDAGIEALCGNSGGRCRLLRSLLVGGCEITEKGAATALRNLPELRRFDYHKILPVIETVYKDCDSDFRLQLEYICHMSFLKNQVTNLTIDAAVALCKNVKEIDIAYMTNNDEWISRLPEFCRLEKLSVSSRSPMISYRDRIAPILERNATTLKTLKLIGCEGVDLWETGVICGNLTELHCAGNSYYSYSVPRATPFLNLREVYFNCFRNEDVPADQLEFLFANCCQVRHLSIFACQTLTDQLIQRACDVNSFSKLRTLSLDECRNVHASSISLIAIKSESLRRIEHYGIEESDLKDLREVVRRGNFELLINDPGGSAMKRLISRILEIRREF